MAKWCGMIGYSKSVETDPGIWEESITERLYYGDVINNIRSLQSSNSVNDNITVSNKISIVADPYAYQNFHALRYVEYMGTKWKISSADVQYPRIILSIGGLYNG